MMHENAACTADPEMREENGSNYIVFAVLGHRASLTCTTEPEWQVPLRQRQPHTPPSRPNRNTTNPKRLDPSRTTLSFHPTTTHHPQPTTPHPSPNANGNTHTQKEGGGKKELRCIATFAARLEAVSLNSGNSPGGRRICPGCPRGRRARRRAPAAAR